MKSLQKIAMSLATLAVLSTAVQAAAPVPVDEQAAISELSGSIAMVHGQYDYMDILVNGMVEMMKRHPVASVAEFNQVFRANFEHQLYGHYTNKEFSQKVQGLDKNLDLHAYLLAARDLKTTMIEAPNAMARLSKKD